MQVYVDVLMSFVGNDVAQINVVSNLAMYICVLNISMRSAFIKPNLLCNYDSLPVYKR